MRKKTFMLLLGVTLTVAACGDRNNRDNAAATPTDEVGIAATKYLATVQKMIATTSDDSEPWDLSEVRAEQSDTAEAVDVM